jgi:putative PIN family toxin of toxin-antitoxin system
VRLFLDTNVLVSAFAARGLSADLFELVRVKHEFVTGRRVLEESERALRLKIRFPPAHCEEIVAYVSSEAALVVDSAPAADCDADRDDRQVLGEALAGQSEIFVTGDAAVAALKVLGPMRILTPRQLWEALRKP